MREDATKPINVTVHKYIVVNMVSGNTYNINTVITDHRLHVNSFYCNQTITP